MLQKDLLRISKQIRVITYLLSEIPIKVDSNGVTLLRLIKTNYRKSGIITELQTNYSQEPINLRV